MTESYTIKELKKRLMEIESTDDPWIETVRLDSRKGAQLALKQWDKIQEKKVQLLKQKETLLIEENKLIQAGYQLIAGVDEVGRGPLAGPVVAAAVLLPPDMEALPINDSKQLSASIREELYEIIMERADVGIGLVEADEVDRINIYEATKVAMLKAIDALPHRPDALLIDAMKLSIPIHQISLIKGDARSYSIAAASIVAKVFRDRLMADYAKEYPYYGFERNAGYGTKTHLVGLEEHGITPIHRKTFEPIKSILKK